jgi:lipopolysaccharide export system protein LptA
MKLISLLMRMAVAAVFVFGSHAVLALTSDSEQPIQVEADFVELDEGTGITVYKGNVIVTQGSIRMTGDKLTINFTDDQDLKDAYLEGRPAYFKQRPENKDYDTEGEALQIEYHARESLLYLIEAAKLTQGQRLFSGHRITYDTERSILTARKARTTEQPGGQAEKPRGRVKLIIPSKKKN